MADRSHLSIGEVLTLLREEFPDVTISKIRFLESQGLLDPERTPSGYRKFYEADVERLRWILQQQREHFLPLKVIRGRLGGEPDEADDLAPGPQPQLMPEPDGREEPATPTPPRTAARGGRVKAASKPLRALEASATLTIEELAEATELAPERLRELERFGLLTSKSVAGTAYYDEEAVAVAHIAAGFLRFGVEARHLKMYKNAADREVGFFEQVVMPLLKQRNPDSRRQALETLDELGRLGESLRAALVKQALKHYAT